MNKEELIFNSEHADSYHIVAICEKSNKKSTQTVWETKNVMPYPHISREEYCNTYPNFEEVYTKP